MKLLKIAGLVLGTAIIVAAGIVVTGSAAEWIDRYVNRVYTPGDAPTATPEARELHESLFIADLHADTMLWDRDLLTQSPYGHVDLPRLSEGNVALQVFAVVTQTPRLGPAPEDARLTNPESDGCLSHEGLNFSGWLQVAQLRPLDVWFDLRKRALYQVARLKRFIEESQERHRAEPNAPYLRLILTAGDLEQLIVDRLNGEPVVGAMLAVEGAHWIGGEGVAVEAGVLELFEAGVRMLAPTHRFNNTLGASSEGCDQLSGLTDEGRAFLDAAEAAGIVLDLAHASDKGIAEASAGRTTPIVVSHTGVRGLCEASRSAETCVYERNMRDEEIQAVARTGGVVAVGYWPEAVGRGMVRVARAFHAAHAALSAPDFVAEMRRTNPAYEPFDHIALGSDFDGAVHTPFHVGDLGLLTASLTASVPPDQAEAEALPPLDEDTLRRIYGANACRVLALRLPEGGPEVAERACGKLRPPTATISDAEPGGTTKP